jgi:hypothetical protein
MFPYKNFKLNVTPPAPKWKSIAAADNKKVSDARTEPTLKKNQYCPSLFNKQAAKT